MKLINLVNDKYRTKTTKEILTDGNTDGQAGLSWQEVNALIKDGHNPKSFICKTAKFLWGIDAMTNSVFKAIDSDNNKIITLEECNKYMLDKCNIGLESIWNKTATEVCNILDNTSKNKKSLN